MRYLLFIMLPAVMPAYAGEVPFDDPRWEFEGESAEIVSVDGREALRLADAQATLEADFENGVIEFDVKVTPERGFHGINFRVHDETNAERFYIRPHQSGNPDANQYTPVFNRLPGWQLYYGPWFSAPVEYRFDEWMHVRIVVSGDQADIYIDSEQPVLHVARLKNKQVAGDLILLSGNAVGHFADFRYEKATDTEIVGTNEPLPSPEAGTVRSWEVSSGFDESSLEGVTELADEHLEGLDWQPLKVEDRGYANLSRVVAFGPESNTAFARLSIETAEATVRTLQFGYSDRARVYLNGELLYAGDNGYRTRDYRYLGTIGLFDSVPLQLQAGQNELLIAVSESFGGWGVMARIADRKGLALARRD